MGTNILAKISWVCCTNAAIISLPLGTGIVQEMQQILFLQLQILLCAIAVKILSTQKHLGPNIAHKKCWTLLPALHFQPRI